MFNRKFVHADGWTWEALETPPPAPTLDGNDGEQSVLYFLSRNESRRCDDFPEEWVSLPTSMLRTLCDRAVPLEVLHADHVRAT
jgi:hypothetical protein